MTMPSKLITSEFLLWAELLLLWSAVSYGASADPLRGETEEFHWKSWSWLLALRAAAAGVLSYALVQSVMLFLFLILITLAQPLLRYRLHMRWIAEVECLWIISQITLSLVFIRHYHFVSRWSPSFLSKAQASALCIVGSALLLVVRGGTYIVRGILKKAGTLPLRKVSSGMDPPVHLVLTPQDVDVKELNRGRLIGNLERIVLTLVVTAGSYSALAFLVAAKGLIRSEEFEKSRDFTEYFLVGSLSSVLIALCAGLALRYALLTLWPDLVGFQMQS
jgi:hypothetical protein